MISRTISTDIIEYFQKKGSSIDEIAEAMDTSSDHIIDIINNKSAFSADNINSYLKSTNIHFWEFAFKAIPLNHLPEKARNRVLLCKKLSDHLKKKK